MKTFKGRPYVELKKFSDGCLAISKDGKTLVNLHGVLGRENWIPVQFMDGWEQTDGSDSTLQYGRKVSETSWEYMEWTDKPWEETKDADYKLANIDDSNWRKEEIDLREYTKEEILEAIETYGYKFEHFSSVGVFNIEQDGYTYSVDDSIQLACECIFELEM